MRIDRLRQLRESRGLTRNDLAKQIQVTEKQIQRYENGENEPTADVLTRLSRVLEVSADYILGLVDSPTDHVREEDLSAMERRLIQALRKGLIVEAVQAFAVMSERVDKPSIPTDEVAVNS